MSEIIPESNLNHRITIEATDPQIIQAFLKSNTQQVVSATPFYSFPPASPSPQSASYVSQPQEFQRLHLATIPLAGFVLLGMTLLITPQGNKVWDSLPVIKTWQQNFVTQKKQTTLNIKDDGPPVFPLAGISGKEAVAGSLPGECRPLGACTRKHAGVDFGASPGWPVLAIESGEIVELNPHSPVGGIIGIKTIGRDEVYRYVHMNRQFLTQFSIGQIVKKGSVISLVGPTFPGSSGPHLHAERYLDGRLDMNIHNHLKNAIGASKP
jgi:murein DD-endopeptidase MepM/ murein hydrolase activator NlpD